MAAKPITDAERKRILELHAAGTSRNDIARETGRSAGIITKVCKDAGLTFDRSTTAAATQAKVKDAAARRADAQLAELEILELNQAHVIGVLKGTKKHRKLVRELGGAEFKETLDFLPADDGQRLANARSSSTTIISNLARLDADRGDDAVKSLLIGFAHKLGLVDEPVT